MADPDLESKQGQKFISFSEDPDRLRGPFWLLFDGYRGPSTTIIRPELEIGH
jgi:hypothetical protein